MIDQQTDVGFEAIQNWFFEKYIPTWVTAGGDSHGDPRKVLDYWGVPMHATVLVTPLNHPSEGHCLTQSVFSSQAGGR